MRAAVIVIDGTSIALIERVRDGRRYYLFPGGQVERGETPEAAAIREALEELGLDVEIYRLVARATFGGNEQRYYLAHETGGRFGAGGGAEMTGEDFHAAGSYRAVLWPVSALSTIDVRPSELALLVERAQTSGWPAEVTELVT
jgi:8-oxo-dGTP diphosphatase